MRGSLLLLLLFKKGRLMHGGSRRTTGKWRRTKSVEAELHEANAHSGGDRSTWIVWRIN
jgi:hypothetical protein